VIKIENKKKKGLLSTIKESMTKTGGYFPGGGLYYSGIQFNTAIVGES